MTPIPNACPTAGRAFPALTAFCLLLGSPAAAAAKSADLRDPTRAFEFEFSAEDSSSALQSYVEFVRKTSPGLDGLKAQFMAADLLLAQGDVQAAVEILQQLAAVSLSDDFFNFSVLQKLGDAYMSLGNYKEAAKAYDDVSKGPVKALIPEATLGKAAAALALGDPKKAYVHFQEMAAFYPSYRTLPRMQLPLGMILWEMGKYGEALEYFKRIPEDPAALYFAGLSQRALSKPSDAVATFRRLQEEHAGTEWADRAKFEMGETFFQQKDDTLAAKTFSEMVTEHAGKRDNWHTLALYRLACTDVRTGKFKDAEGRLLTLYRQEGSKILMPNVTYLLSESYAKQGKIEPIVKILQDQAKSGFVSGDANYRLIWALTALGRYKEALPLTDEYLNAEWEQDLTPKTLLVQGWAYEKKGDIPDALATYHLVVEHFPTTMHAPRALELMTMNYYRTQQYTPVVTQVRHMWSTLPAEQRKKNPNTLFWIAETHLAMKNSVDAARYYKEFIEDAKPENPLVPQAYHGMAVAAAQNRNFTLSVSLLQRAVKAAKDAGNPELAASLSLDTANAQFNGKSYEGAASTYRQFQKDAPQSDKVPFALFQEGLSLQRAEYYSDAITAWQKLVDGYPNDPKAPDALMRMSKTRFDMGKSSDAVAGYQLFIKKYPDDPQVKDAHLQIGQSWFNAGQYALAAEAYVTFLKLYAGDPQAAQVTQLLQTCYYQMKLSPEEIEKRTSGQAKSAVLADMYWEEAAKLYNEKKYPKALEHFQKILFEFPSSSVAPQASFYRAESLFLMEKYAEAIPAFENFIQYYPEDASRSQAMFHLSVSIFNQGDFPKAGAAFKRFAETFPDDPLAQSAVLNSALCYAKAGDVENAVKGYLQYAATYPKAEDLGKIYLQLGDFLEKASQPAQAADAYARIPEGYAERPQGLYQAAEAYKKLSDEGNQKKMYAELSKGAAKGDPYRIAGLLQWAELLVTANDLKGAQALYQDVAANAQDDQSKTLAQEQLKVLQSAKP